MKYCLLAAMVGALCSLSCLDDSGPPSGGGYGSGFSCEQLTSCAACTPVLGCGWCQSGDKGLCTSEPNRCAQVASFSWTWELAFCPAAPDGGVHGWTAVPPNDAAAPEVSTESGAGEALDGAADRAPDAPPHE